MKFDSQWVQHGSGPMRTSALILPRFEALAPLVADDTPAEPPFMVPPPPSFAKPNEADLQARIEALSTQAAQQVAALQKEVTYWQDYAQRTESDARERGYAEGFASGETAGHAAGEAAARAQAQTLLNTLLGLTERCVFATQATVAASRETLASLSIAIARQIVSEAFALDETLLARRIVPLLERLNDVTTATVRLHPSDLATVQRQWVTLAQTYGWGDAGPRLLGDDSIASGGCIIEAKSHYTDARIETLFDLVREAFAKVSPLAIVAPSVADDDAPKMDDTSETNDAPEPDDSSAPQGEKTV